MSCKYKYNNQWYTKEEVFSLLLKERNINSKGELIKPNISNPKLSKKFEVVNDWDINNDGSSKTIKRFNTKEEADEYIKNIQEYHDAAGYKYGVIVIPFATNGIEPKITNKTLKESIYSIKSRTGYKITVKPISKEIYEKAIEDSYSQSNGMIGEWTEDGVVYFVDLNDTVRLRRDKFGYFEESGANSEYTEQALINTKIAALKEVAKKYPRSLIRSEVKSFSDFNNNTDDIIFFQKLPNSSPVLNEENYIFSQEEIEQDFRYQIKQDTLTREMFKEQFPTLGLNDNQIDNVITAIENGDINIKCNL